MKKRAVLLAVLLPCTLSLSACGPDPDALLIRAKAEVAAADDRSARIDLIELLKARPGDVAALEMLARAQIRLGDGDGALATLDRLAAAGHQGEGLNRLRAEAELRRGQADVAIKLLDKDGSADAWRIRAAAQLAKGDAAGAYAAFEAGSKAGTDAALAIDYARFLMASEDFSGAERLLAVARRQAPQAFDTIMLEADLLARQQRPDLALTAYRRAAKLAPRRLEPLLGQAELADAAGKIDEAARLIDAAAIIEADDPRVARWKIQIAQMKGDWASVRASLAPREASLDPVSPEGLAYAEALLRLGQPEQARALFRRTLALSPQNPYARLMLAEATLATGDGAGAFETLRPLIASPAAGDRELALAEQAARAAHLPEADAIAQRRVTAGSHDGQNLAIAARQAYARGDWAAAVAAYSALNARGEDPDVLRHLALANSQAGQHDAAITAADRAKVLAPTNPDALYAAGLVRYNAGRDLAKAVSLLQAASTADPANTLFRNALARARGGRAS